jgi:hypothetical protein
MIESSRSIRKVSSYRCPIEPPSRSDRSGAQVLPPSTSAPAHFCRRCLKSRDERRKTADLEWPDEPASRWYSTRWCERFEQTRSVAQHSVDNQRKRVWWLRTLLPGLPRESVVASFRLPGPSGTHSTIHFLKLRVRGPSDRDVSLMAYSVYTYTRVRTSSTKS